MAPGNSRFTMESSCHGELNWGGVVYAYQRKPHIRACKTLHCMKLSTVLNELLIGAAVWRGYMVSFPVAEIAFVTEEVIPISD